MVKEQDREQGINPIDDYSSNIITLIYSLIFKTFIEILIQIYQTYVKTLFIKNISIFIILFWYFSRLLFDSKLHIGSGPKKGTV